jgi:hypothetical protein
VTAAASEIDLRPPPSHTADIQETLYSDLEQYHDSFRVLHS